MLVAIALGSNLGDRAAELAAGRNFLQTLATKKIRTSTIHETAPVDCPPGSPSFLNQVAEIETDLSPQQLLHHCQTFERQRGRPQIRALNAPRPLDLDLLYAGNQILNEPDLILPHPRLTQRRFVLQPLAELSPNLILPTQTKTVAQLLADLSNMNP